jgi:hypothetical protein
MRVMKLFKLILVFFAIGFSSRCDAQSTLCDSWLLRHNWRTGERLGDLGRGDMGRVDELWLFSYLIFKAGKQNLNISEFTDQESAKLMMAKYCYKNPLLKLDEAADQVFEELKNR